nr:NAD(P)-dependent oxidoreductase [Sagittula salina]
MIALTGASGLVGQWLSSLADLTLGRHDADRPWSLAGPAPDLTGVTTLIHAAFSHVPGRYRGGEGNDPDGFLAANLDGTKRLFDAAAQQGVTRILFLSSRAVFDGLSPGASLPETLAPKPKSLYGELKARCEDHLFALAQTSPLTGLSLRATGIYGPSAPFAPPHKWTELFADYRAGHTIVPRRGTEVHGKDLRLAARLLLMETTSGPAHVSDLLLDRRDLLSEVQRLTACPHPPPEPCDTPVSPLICTRLNALGWRPGGMELLRQSLPAMLT